MHILALADIHGNYPALKAVEQYFQNIRFDLIINCGDSTVYGPFPNETLQWLKKKEVLSILGNTDKKVLRLLKNKRVKKPKKEEKRIMYTWTKDILNNENIQYLKGFKEKRFIHLKHFRSHIRTDIHLFHGSPENPDEFLFAHTPDTRFSQLAHLFSDAIILVGHSHSPFHKTFGSTHFINPGSVGRMFDGDPRASCATLHIEPNGIHVKHYRIPYHIKQVVDELKKNRLPEIYAKMYLLGKKLN